jgi:translation initiation factor 2B subunit (eIF-2B alpha/beta/delta family)
LSTAPDIEALVAPLRADATSGAAELTHAAASVIESATEQAPADSGASLVEWITSLIVAVLDAQPTMAPLATMARELLGWLDPTASVDEARSVAAAAVRAFRESLSAAATTAARNAASKIPAGVVLTISRSATVRDALITAAATRPVEVVCLESRPLGEGNTLAGELASAGLAVTLAVDAAADRLMQGCGSVLLGADSIGDRGVVNKIGSAALARGAVHRGIPLLVAADSSKLLPAGLPQPLGVDRPAEELGSVPAGARVWNRYFDVFPADQVTLFLSERGALTPAELERQRRALAVPAVLAAWAARQP